MRDAILIGVMMIVVAVFFAVLSASISINSYHKESISDDFDDIEYDENGNAL